MQRLVADVLTAWRSAERLAGDLAPDDAARPAVLAAVEQLQATFNELTMATGERPEQAASGTRSDAGSAVHEISQDLAADARRLHSIENQKSRIGMSDQRVVELSVEARNLATGIAQKTEEELEVAEEAVG